MGRLARFDDHRFVGTRDDMHVYDCDDDADFTELMERVATAELFRRNLLQTFGPDSLAEARNRGFRPT